MVTDPMDAMLDAMEDTIEDIETADERQNVVLAAGGLTGALWKAGVECEPVHDHTGCVTGELIVKFDFMKSPYKITLERMTDDV